MCVIWGIPYLFIRVAVHEMSPAVLVFGRTVLGAAILLPIALARGEIRAVLARWPFVLLFAALEIAIPWVALSTAAGPISRSLPAPLLSPVPLGWVPGPGHMPVRGALGAVVGLAVVCPALGFVFFFALIGEIGAVRATVITYINPAVAAVLGIAVLQESFTFGMGIGFALVLIGSALATRRTQTRAVTEPVELAVSGGPR